MKKKHKQLDENNIRVIKIGKKALFEFIYENFIDNQKMFLDVEPLDVTDTFDINYESGEFIFCVYKLKNEKGEIIKLPEEIDLQQLMQTIPDTTSTMYDNGRYKEYTKDELIKLSKKQ